MFCKLFDDMAACGRVPERRGPDERGRNIISACFWRMLGHLYGKFIEIIGLKAPGNSLTSIWSNKCSFLIGKTTTSHFHDFWIFGTRKNPYL